MHPPQSVWRLCAASHAGHVALALLVLSVWSPAQAGETESPPRPFQEWEIIGLTKALGDPLTEVKVEALRRLSENDRVVTESREARECASHAARLLKEGRDRLLRWWAMKALGKMGAAAKEVAPQVAELLTDSSPGVRGAAAAALGNMGPAAREFAPRVADLLKDKDAEVRGAAAEAFGGIGAAAKGVAPQLAKLLEDKDPGVRRAAAEALGGIGAAAKEVASQVAKLLEDNDPGVRRAAAMGLGKMGSESAPQLAVLLTDSSDGVRRPAAIGATAKEVSRGVAVLLSHPFADVRSAAAAALGNMGPAAKESAAQVVELLKDKDETAAVRLAATLALGKMGAAPKEFALQILELLRHKDFNVRCGTGKALRKMGATAKEFVPQMAVLLTDKDPSVRGGAALALGEMGPAAEESAAQVVKLLMDKNETSYVREAAAFALGKMGATGYSSQVANLLKDKYSGVRRAAVEALGNMGPAAKEFAAQVVEHLKDKDENGAVPLAAALALGKMGATEFSSQVASLLKDENEIVRGAAAEALGNMGPAARRFARDVAKLIAKDPPRDSSPIPAARGALLAMGPLSDKGEEDVAWQLLEVAYGYGHVGAQLIVDTYVLFGQNAAVIKVIPWLRNRSSEERSMPKPPPKGEIGDLLRALGDVLPDTSKFPNVAGEAAKHISSLVDNTHWWPGDDQRLLEDLQKRLSDHGHPDQALAVARKLSGMQKARWFTYICLLAAAHAVFWVFLIFAYPHSRSVQIVFFWHPWVRRIFGLGYVSLLIMVVPSLRRRLLAPFRASLVPQRALEDFEGKTFFSAIEMLPKGKRAARSRLVTEALVPLEGQWVLEGASGLGKTTILRYLASSGLRTAVFLRAVECGEGVMAAIQSRLQGQARDESFLRALVHAGAVDVLVDGLNEGSPDTRARIVNFVQESFRGNVILTTQPLQWDPPVTAQVWELKPLKPEQIEAFVLQQWVGLESAAKVTKEAYEASSEEFLGELARQAPEDPLAAERLLLLCNPMEAVLAAELLAEGQKPELGRLLEQRYKTMAKAFRDVHARDFPQGPFAERVFEWRASGQPHIDTTNFESEVGCLVEHKLMLLHQERLRLKDGAREENRWVFRHDKVLDYFLVPAFTGEHRERRGQHVDDPRFVGVYDLLAELLPPDEVEELHRFLVNHAADTNQNGLLNRFTLLLRSRMLRESAAASSTDAGPGEPRSLAPC